MMNNIKYTNKVNNTFYAKKIILLDIESCIGTIKLQITNTKFMHQ